MLDANTGIYVDDNYVQPLYKQILNIEHPTMAFIGITEVFFAMDLQVNGIKSFYFYNINKNKLHHRHVLH